MDPHSRRGATNQTSTQVLSEDYVNATRRLSQPLSPAEAWDDVVAMFAWRPVPVDDELLRGARGIERRFRLSWGDSLIVSAAQAQQCSLLLSEDLQHGSVVNGVRVQNPFVSGVSEGPPAPIRRKPRSSRMQL